MLPMAAAVLQLAFRFRLPVVPSPFALVYHFHLDAPRHGVELPPAVLLLLAVVVVQVA